MQEMNGDDVRSPPRAPSRVSAAQLKALKRFGAVQVPPSLQHSALVNPCQGSLNSGPRKPAQHGEMLLSVSHFASLQTSILCRLCRVTLLSLSWADDMSSQVGGNAKRPRLEGPSGPLARLPTKNTSSFILLNGNAPDPRGDDDSDGGHGGSYGGGSRRRPLSTGLPPLKVTPGGGGILAAPGSPDHHPPSSHRPHLLSSSHHHHHHHGHGGGQHGMSLLGSSPRGGKMPQHRVPGGTFGTLLENFEPELREGALGGMDLAKAVQRTHGIGKASAA